MALRINKEFADQVSALSKKVNPLGIWPKDLKLALAMPHSMSVISTATHYSLMGVKRPPLEDLVAPRGGDIAEKREKQAEEAFYMGCTHIWFVDGDMAFRPNTLVDLFALLNQGASLAGGLCYCGYPPWDPIAWHPTENRMMLPFIDFKFGDIIEPRATGCACLLIKREVFEGVKRPWFLTKYEGLNTTPSEGEDVYFTSRAVKAGFKLMINTKHDVDHMREFPVNREIFFMSQLMTRLLGKEKKWGRVERLWQKTNDPEWLDNVLNDVLNEREEERK